MGESDCKQIPRDLPAPPATGLYVHVPWCAAKCRYCDFYSLPLDIDLARAFGRALRQEWDLRQDELAEAPRSLFVGGGTPTALPADVLESVLALLAPRAGADTEFTVEANPGTIDAETADRLARFGVTRVSLGAQSFRAEELCALGRRHTPQQTRQSVEHLRSAGIENLSLDLMYGIPGQDAPSWRDTLGEALALQPRHLSCYALSFEPGTPLEADRRAGRVRPMDDAEQERCYRLAIEAAAGAGLTHYELSNFALPGRECRHNLLYWRNRPYVGLGPGATSYDGGTRRTTRPDLPGYLACLAEGTRAPVDQECLTGRARMAETLMLGLRLIEGVSRKEFAARFGCDPADVFPRTIRRYLSQGALQLTSGHLRTAPTALFVSDSILADLLAEA